ncbi:MAG: hypothetical protein A3B91_00845 [Candidatus Yanofskybacteria bacterium RIFCSPHIGHO2_02_FULL_41_29]|uniref:Uncharacterized protein n=1 Tax=Candidatus Yanofskybacteria bacterium RIFCSPHIGHO2_01_FULL_41_53 TaxID=1802663 RepID=A0A1F8EJV3_9BACT|nr:MAG: hypothetical protein A2650_00420 [Candidatus Yanofskybacteria bacterium RIFCSPHIGHO2_01_FULL_41_53]OGN12290.1 MAG: hypothetical protein A3B91_00845 [Candidatus Yanofskybacteria bacterium RIFCSPHIGHO2_02_FULL_41_29]OGN17028.1 MAG: hypothetical protein A3F48_03720 [Candidatus Yanofskybacteria bacterium RIFCSPHIGHO2_12_FULL_41_9]OGN23610.1 MAG: hypothetical protein A2916_01465 [Candidatus Yanofskybacteria bacterium RIFCSPLOWO2_01_FULL_41_67]OGN29403.1 MAG: hypothetical protein A3H54_04060 
MTDYIFFDTIGWLTGGELWKIGRLDKSTVKISWPRTESLTTGTLVGTYVSSEEIHFLKKFKNLVIRPPSWRNASAGRIEPRNGLPAAYRAGFF